MILVLLMLCACSTTRDPAARDPIGSAVEQPFRDLSLLREIVPEAVARAASEPYRAGRDCALIGDELASLDEVLGPDVDVARAKEDGAGLAGAVVAGATALPFRGVVRRLTGAHQRERAVEAAVLGAIARRAFLKGQRSALGCEGARS